MNKFKNKVLKHYDALSYQGKFRLIFNILFIGIIILFLVVTLIYSNLLSDEIYEKHQEKLTYLSQKIENEFNLVESLTTEIHQNAAVQNSLLITNSASISSKRYIEARNNGSKEITWLLADKLNVTKTVLLNNKKRNITNSTYDDKNFFNGDSLDDVLAEIPRDYRGGKWFFTKDLSQGIFIQNIFIAKRMSIQRAGILIVFVNTNFVQQAIEAADYFKDKDFYFLQYGNTYMSSVQKDFQSNLQAIRDSGVSVGSRQFHFVTTSNGKYFLYPKIVKTNTSEFIIYYFLLNNQVIQVVIRTVVIFGLILIFFGGTCYLLVNHYLRRLLLPINNLVLAMQRFKGESDLETLQALQQPATLRSRQDEIGKLYTSFQQLISEIQDFVIKDYQTKLLASEMEFRFLQAQLDPHFLYNTLNSINWLAINKGDWEISEMVTALSKLLRKKLDNNHEFTMIKEELELIRAYIKIQSVRFDERLIYKEKVDQKLIEINIPQLILQPLVENSIKYGVERFDRPVTILVSIYRSENSLVLKVTDDGPGFGNISEPNEKSTGVGIANIKSRLSMIYNDKSSLSIESEKNTQTTVTIKLPYEENTNRRITNGKNSNNNC